MAAFCFTSFAQVYSSFGRPVAGEAQSTRTVLTLQPSGLCTLTNDTITSRAAAEQMARAWERAARRETAEDEEDEADNTAPAAAPLTDEVLAKKLREAAKLQAEQAREESAAKIDLLEVTTNQVRTVSSRVFPNLAGLLQNAYQVWSQSGLQFENMRLEKNTNGNLQVTLTPYANMQRYSKQMRDRWKLTGFKSEWKLVLPGKVLSSGLPHARDNATWISIDATNEPSLQAAAKLWETPTVISAELGGLALERPLDSKGARLAVRRNMSQADELPVTDAGPGFVAEALSVTTTTLFYFPEGEKFLKGGNPFDSQPAGLVVQAKLFAPRGRWMRSLSGQRVLKAVDDKGRPISVSDKDDPFPGGSFYSGGSRDSASARMQLRLGLPQADAQSIDELLGEAVVETVGSWKTLTLTNLPDAKQEIDLGGLLPGAKLQIARFTAKERQFSVQAKLAGPPAIRRFDLQLKLPGNKRFNAYSSDRNTASKAGQSTRAVEIQGNDYASDVTGPAQSASLLLVVRYPEDLKRERVQFRMTGLDF